MAIDGIGGEIKNILVVVAQVGSGIEVLGVFCEENIAYPVGLDSRSVNCLLYTSPSPRDRG